MSIHMFSIHQGSKIRETYAFPKNYQACSKILAAIKFNLND